MSSEQRGPDFIPYSDWMVIEEQCRRKRSWVVGAATVLVFIAVGSALTVPILNRRAVIRELSSRFEAAGQVITIEEHVGPNNVRLDRKLIEETASARRIEIDEGNVIFFSGDEGGTKLDRRRRTLYTYPAVGLPITPFARIKDLLSQAAKDVRTSVQKSDMADGVLKLVNDRTTYLIRPGQGSRLATIDVQSETDLGWTTVIQWRIEKAPSDISKFYPATFTRIPAKEAPTAISDFAREEAFLTDHGQARVVRVDVNEKGDVFVVDQSQARIEFQINVTDGSVYSFLPTTTIQPSNASGLSARQNLAYRKRGVNLSWPYTIELLARPVDSPSAKPYVIRRTFKEPTCTFVPEYEFGLAISDGPITTHRVRGYLCEASLAETGFGLVRYANADVPVRDAVNALTYYRFVTTYFGSVDTTRFTASQARIYYSIYRCYDAARQTQLAQNALKMANARNRGQNPWLDQKINEAYLREGLIEAE